MENIIKNRIKETLKFIETETNTEREDNLLRGEIAFLEHLLDYAHSSLKLNDKHKTVIEELEKDLKDYHRKHDKGKINDLEYLRHTSFIKGKLSILLNF